MPQAHQVVACCQHNTTLFAGSDAGTRPAVCAAGAFSHLHKYQRAVGSLHDQVNFATTASWRSIIACQQAQTCPLQMGERTVFGGIASLLGGDAAWCGCAAVFF